MTRLAGAVISFCPPTSWLTASQEVSQQRISLLSLIPSFLARPAKMISMFGGKVP